MDVGGEIDFELEVGIEFPHLVRLTCLENPSTSLTGSPIRYNETSRQQLKRRQHKVHAVVNEVDGDEVTIFGKIVPECEG